MTAGTPTWNGRHGKGAMKAHREQKRIDAIERLAASTRAIKAVLANEAFMKAGPPERLGDE